MNIETEKEQQRRTIQEKVFALKDKKVSLGNAGKFLGSLASQLGFTDDEMFEAIRRGLEMHNYEISQANDEQLVKYGAVGLCARAREKIGPMEDWAQRFAKKATVNAR